MSVNDIHDLCTRKLRQNRGDVTSVFSKTLLYGFFNGRRDTTGNGGQEFLG